VYSSDFNRSSILAEKLLGKKLIVKKLLNQILWKQEWGDENPWLCDDEQVLLLLYQHSPMVYHLKESMSSFDFNCRSILAENLLGKKLIIKKLLNQIF
jgi:hypothetical protein